MVDGIAFKSKLEAYCYNQLKANGIEALYEPQSFLLIPAFEYQGEKIRKMTYKPDFVGDGFIIECKGQITDSFPLRWKIFKYTLHLTNSDTKLFIVRNHKQIDEVITKLKQK
jgi:hypothetical protein